MTVIDDVKNKVLNNVSMPMLQTQKKPLRLTFNDIASKDSTIKMFIQEYKLNVKHKNAIIISIQHEIFKDYEIGYITLKQIESFLEKLK